MNNNLESIIDFSFKEKYPYYLENNILLINADCKDIIPLLRNDSIDVCFTDPPYNICSEKHFTKKGNTIKLNKEVWGNLYQDYWENPNEYWDWILNIFLELKNKVKYHYIVFLDRLYTGHFNYLIKDHFDIRNQFCFIKNNPIPHFRKTNFCSGYELATWFSKEYRKIEFTIQKEMSNVFTGSIGKKQTKHPNEKYDWMVLPVVKSLVKDGDVVIDLFCGSGSILYHTIRVKNVFCIGIEKNKDFFNEAVEKFSCYFKNYVLF
jgi:site-specific DNA-methyltransferase (adenine-specific)